MKTLVMAVQKGGVGKTSILSHIAYDFAERGLRVLVVDLTQAGAISQVMRMHGAMIGPDAVRLFAEGEAQWPGGKLGEIVVLPSSEQLSDLEGEITWETANELLRRHLEALADGFDVCLFDTDPTQGVCISAALTVADFALSPVKLDYLGLQGVERTFIALGNVRRVNPELEILGLLPSLVDMRVDHQVRGLAELREAYPDETLPVQVALRNTVAEVMGEGTPVWKSPKTSARKAAREMRDVAAYVHARMGLADME